MAGGRNYEQRVCAEFKRSHFPKEDLSRRKLEALVVVAADDVSVMPPTTEREREWNGIVLAEKSDWH